VAFLTEDGGTEALVFDTDGDILVAFAHEQGFLLYAKPLCGS